MTVTNMDDPAPAEDQMTKAEANGAADSPDDAVAPIEFLASGMMRVTIEGTRYRMRRPGLGDLKALRSSLWHIEDEVVALQSDATTALAELTAESKAIEAKGEDVSDEDRAQIEVLARRSREKSRALVLAADELREQWWQEVFDRLVLHGRPPLPSWVVDASLPGRVMSHWRFGSFRSVDSRSG